MHTDEEAHTKTWDKEEKESNEWGEKPLRWSLFQRPKINGQDINRWFFVHSWDWQESHLVLRKDKPLPKYDKVGKHPCKTFQMRILILSGISRCQSLIDGRNGPTGK